MTRETGVCWLITSLTSTDHGLVSGSRQGRGRMFWRYQDLNSLLTSSSKASTVVCALRICILAFPIIILRLHNVCMSNSEWTPESVWQSIIRGNRRFVEGKSAHPRQNEGRRQELTHGQKPKAVVLACSDSRVPVEIIFDQGLGDIFVIRTAGEITDLSVLASLEFAVDGLGVKLVVVLGHESCGAVAAAKSALDGGDLPGGFQRVLIEKVTPSLLAARKDGQHTTDEFERRHVQEIVNHIVDRSPEISSRLDAGEVGVVGLRYRLSDGLAETVVTQGVSENPLP